MKTVSTTEADDNQSAQLVEADSHCSNQVDFLRFEVNFILKLVGWVSPLYKKIDISFSDLLVVIKLCAGIYHWCMIILLQSLYVIKGYCFP